MDVNKLYHIPLNHIEDGGWGSHGWMIICDSPYLHVLETMLKDAGITAFLIDDCIEIHDRKNLPTAKSFLDLVYKIDPNFSGTKRYLN
jgi:hypothetical protein